MGCRFTRSDISLRLIREPEDMLLLQHIYATSRDYETRYWGLEEPLLTRILIDQFLIQHRQYRQIAHAKCFIVENREGVPLGRFYTHDASEAEIRVMDIALLPVYRGVGIGKILMTQIMERAGQEGKQVTLHVGKSNPARFFYEKLGFGFAKIGDVYDLLVWPAQNKLSK